MECVQINVPSKFGTRAKAQADWKQKKPHRLPALGSQHDSRLEDTSMATNDVTSHEETCPCGKGTVKFTTSSPDHAWVRPHQTIYSAVIECEECREEYSVYQKSSNDLPVVVHRKEIDAKKATRERYRVVEEAIGNSQEAERLRAEIVSSIDSESSMAARHRSLAQLGLFHGTYSTYRRRPCDGAEATRRIRGVELARIGSTTSLGGEDQGYFAKVRAELEELDREERSIRLRIVNLACEPS